MSDKYILVGHMPVIEPDLMKWARWFEYGGRIVASTKTRHGQISTVFLGLDHALGDGEPLLFETMVFGGPLDGSQERYSTWDEAIDGHKEMISRAGNAA